MSRLPRPDTSAAALAVLRAFLRPASSAAALAVLLTLSPSPARAQDAAARLDALQDEAVRLTREYLRVNTINPPGNESRAVEFFARVFDAEGIEHESAESAPGRGNIWARIEGTGDAPALVLLHHSDVVPSDPAFWSTDPMAAEVVDGVIYGRGALDTKTLGILHLAAFLDLHRSGIRPDRDVIFMATADEEAGGAFGAGWLVENRPELFAGVGTLLNEGGGGSIEDGRKTYGIEVTQKVPVWLRLVAEGEPGHGSRPLVESAPGRLVRALERVRTHRFEARAVPAVAAYLRGLAEGAPDRWAERLRDPDALVRNPDWLMELQLWQPSLHALLRNTCSITVLEGSGKINVVPPSARAELDCRVLPDQDLEAFLAELATAINDPAVRIETLMAFTPAISSTGSDVFRTLAEVTREHHPDAVVVPSVLTGFTDSHFFRDLGIDSYGYSPLLVPQEHQGGVHGNDERVSEENVRQGTRMMVEILRRIVTRRGA